MWLDRVSNPGPDNLLTLIRSGSAPAYLIESQLFKREFANSILLEEKSSLSYQPSTMSS